MTRVRFTVATAIVLALFSMHAWAQGGTGALAGTVTDAQGAVIANAKLELSNAQTGDKESQSTTGAGTYRFAPLSVVGKYTLTVEAPGFKRYQVAGIEVSVGTVVNRNIQLEVGAAGDTVNVEATAQLVQTTESQVSQLVDSRVWSALPLEARNQNTFINLLAGVVPDDQAGSTRGAAVNGARGGTGNFLVEGFDNNDQGQGGRGVPVGPGGAVTSISPEAIQEYRVITNSYNAEYGKGGGFVTDTSLKSGTNSYHGSLFWYNRVQALAANDFFSNRAGLKDSLVRNQAGGSFGGPIIKDRTFVYGTVEIHRLRQSAPLGPAGSITQDFIDFVDSGAFQTFMETDPNGFCVVNIGAACAGAFANSATLGPIFRNLLNVSPIPLATDSLRPDAEGFFTGGLIYPVNIYGDATAANPFFLNENRFTVKVDHRFGDKDQLSGTYLFQDADQGSALDGGDITFGPSFFNPDRAQLAGIVWTHTFSPTVVNQARVTYLRHRSDFPNAVGLEDVPSIFTFFDSPAFGFGNSSALPQFFTDNQFQYKDDISFVRGKHTFKAGGEYRRTRNGSRFEATSNGLFGFNSIEELMTDGFFGEEADAVLGTSFGSLGQSVASVNPLTSLEPIYYRGYRANEFAFYFQDEWRATSRLTLNIGLRWEYFGVPHNFQPGLDSNFYFGSTSTPVAGVITNPFFPINDPFAASINTANFQQRDSDIWAKDKNNFAPRVGLAWDVFGTGKFVVRGGFGIGYDRLYNNVFENIRFNPPFFSTNTINGPSIGGSVAMGPTLTPGLYSVPFTAASTAQFNNPAFQPLPNPRHMDENILTAYYEQANFGLQWEFAKDFALETNYIGTFGRQLTGIADINSFSGRTACSSVRPVCTAAFNAGQIPTATFSSRRISTIIVADNFRSNFGNSSYHGLQAILRKRFSYGLQFNANYTYSKALDVLSDAFNNRLGLRPTNNWNPADDYGNADFDIKHRFVLSGYYDLPFWKSHSILGGWAINGILSLQAGVPVALFSSAFDTNRDGYFTDRPQFIGSGSPNSTRTGNSPADGYFDTSQFRNAICPATENFGIFCENQLGRGALTGPGFRNLDFGVHKRFKVTEKVSVQVQANFFNIFNHPNFRLPSGNINNCGAPLVGSLPGAGGGGVCSSGSPGTFGRSVSTFGDNGGHRITQLALRIDF